MPILAQNSRTESGKILAFGRGAKRGEALLLGGESRALFLRSGGASKIGMLRSIYACRQTPIRRCLLQSIVTRFLNMVGKELLGTGEPFPMHFLSLGGPSTRQMLVERRVQGMSLSI